MSIRRVCAAVIVGLAMSAGMVGSSYADSNGRYPNSAYGYDAYHGKKFKRSNLSCDQSRDICYDRFGISYYATARYLGEREANRAYKKYGSQVFLFSPRAGVVCDRRTDSCSMRGWGNSNYDKDFRRSTQARDGFGAIGSPSDWRYQQQQQQQQPPYWQFND